MRAGLQNRLRGSKCALDESALKGAQVLGLGSVLL